MICPRCLKREATVHISKNVNGKKEEYVVCNECAKEMGFFGSSDLLFNMGDFISGFMGKGITPSLSDQKKCPACGMTLTELSRTSKLGCSNCYEIFDDYLDPVMKKIHGNSRHVGKLPQTADDNFKKQHQISSLKEDLKAAVGREDFEQAAVLRDNIRELEEET